MRKKPVSLPVIVDSQDPFMAERFREIMTNLQFMKTSKQQPFRSIVMTSAHKGEGKSFCALNLAIAYAKQNKRVLLIDADLHKPRLTKIFRFRSARGLSTVLANQAEPLEVIRSTKIPLLSFLPSGVLPADPLELLNSQLMEETVNYYKKEFDLVILDTPPMLLINDSRVLGSFCDGVILVVKSGATKVKDVETAMDLLALSESHLIGTILNAKKFSQKEWQTYSYD